jgi:hypothetical protein
VLLFGDGFDRSQLGQEHFFGELNLPHTPILIIQSTS